MIAPPIRLLERIAPPSEWQHEPNATTEHGSSRVLVQTPERDWTARALLHRVRARAMSFADPDANVRVVTVDKGLDDVVTILAGLSLGNWVVVQNPHSGAARWTEPVSWPSALHGQAGVVIATSGSTGTPKWVAISEAALGWSAVAASLRLGLRADDVLALQLPLFHVGGLGQLFRALWMHVPLLIGTASTPGSLQAHGATIISVVPTQLARWIQQGYRGDGFRAVIVGGAPLTASLREAALSHGFPVRTTYGATETASMISLSENAPAAGTSGRLLAYRGLVVDADRAWVTGRTVALGHWVNGVWVPTDGRWEVPDVLQQTDDGQLVVAGRRDRVIISGGENIMLARIEHIICTLPGVLQALALGWPDDDLGTRPIVIVQQTPHAGSPERLMEQLKPLLHGLERPMRILPWPDGVAHKWSEQDARAYAASLL